MASPVAAESMGSILARTAAKARSKQTSVNGGASQGKCTELSNGNGHFSVQDHNWKAFLQIAALVVAGSKPNVSAQLSTVQKLAISAKVSFLR